MDSDEKIYRVNEVIEKTGLPKSTLYAKMKDGDFPRPIKLGKRAVGWKSKKVHLWVETKSDLSE